MSPIYSFPSDGCDLWAWQGGGWGRGTRGTRQFGRKRVSFLRNILPISFFLCVSPRGSLNLELALSHAHPLTHSHYLTTSSLCLSLSLFVSLSKHEYHSKIIYPLSLSHTHTQSLYLVTHSLSNCHSTHPLSLSLSLSLSLVFKHKTLSFFFGILYFTFSLSLVWVDFIFLWF